MILTDSIEFFNIGGLISFLIGFACGLLVFFLIFIIAISKDKRDKKHYKAPTIKDISEEQVKQLITSKQKVFIEEIEEFDKDPLKMCLSLSLELIHEISSYYYPKSNYPEYELTVKETQELLTYILEQVFNLFNKPIISNLKHIKLSTIKKAYDKGTKVKNSKVAKAYKNSAASEAYSVLRTIANTINPVFWFKKIVINGTINATIKQICKTGLSIVGKESNKVYSKKLFNKDALNDNSEEITELFSDEE